MRVMVAIPHYFRPTAEARHASTDGRAPEARRATVRGVFETWRHRYASAQASLNIAARAYERVPPRVSELALFAITTGGHHLLDAEFCRACGINHVEIEPDDPKTLGFHAHVLFAEHARRFDLYVFSEDDLVPHDPSFLDKQAWFAGEFGPTRLLMPNRYEWNRQGPAPKTYVDGDLVPRLTEPWFQALPDAAFLAARPLGRRVSFERARNPHSGYHALTSEQLKLWMGRPHWGDRDASFVSPLESSATLTMLKTFPVYKAYGPDQDFFEIEHRDLRFSTLGRRG